MAFRTASDVALSSSQEPASRTRGAAVLLLGSLLSIACGDDGDGGTPSNDPTFTRVMTEAVSSRRCGGPTCHSNATMSGFVMGSTDTLYAALVNQPASGPDCASTGMMLVVPGDPDNSLLYLKLTTAPCGDAMPPTGSGALPADAVELVRQWILAGAKKD